MDCANTRLDVYPSQTLVAIRVPVYPFNLTFLGDTTLHKRGRGNRDPTKNFGHIERSPQHKSLKVPKVRHVYQTLSKTVDIEHHAFCPEKVVLQRGQVRRCAIYCAFFDYTYHITRDIRIEVSPRWGLERAGYAGSINMPPRWGCGFSYMMFFFLRQQLVIQRGRGNRDPTKN